MSANQFYKLDRKYIRMEDK